MYVLVVVTMLIVEEQDKTVQTVSMHDFASRQSCGAAQRKVLAAAKNVDAYCVPK